ncbi:MAG: hypothetical protein HXX09_00820 [Bacteroidetes bacterium]|nr:hypothetical protein [Bacteroidota bacterium]
MAQLSLFHFSIFDLFKSKRKFRQGESNNFPSKVFESPQNNSKLEQIERLCNLIEYGLITEEEFQERKSKYLIMKKKQFSFNEKKNEDASTDLCPRQ